MAIKDEYVAACLDEAVAVFGLWVESRLNMVEGKDSEEVRRKSERELLKMLGEEPGYADPAAFVR